MRGADVVDVVGEVAQDGADEVERNNQVGGHECGKPARSSMSARAAEAVLGDRHAGERFDHRRAGHEGVAAVDEHHGVSDPEQERRTGDHRAVDNEQRRHDARGIRERLRCPTPRDHGIEAVVDRYAVGGHDGDDGQPLLACRAEAGFERHGIDGGQALRLGEIESDAHDSSAVEVGKTSRGAASGGIADADTVTHGQGVGEVPSARSIGSRGIAGNERTVRRSQLTEVR